MMRSTFPAAALFLTATIMVPAGARAQPSAGCAPIVAVLDESGGGLSADEIAKKTNTDVETVRNCTDEWRKAKAGAKAPAGAAAGAKAAPSGCAPIVAVLDQGGGGLSADEIAKKTNTDVETVRSCTDQWRKSMGGGH